MLGRSAMRLRIDRVYFEVFKQSVCSGCLRYTPRLDLLLRTGLAVVFCSVQEQLRAVIAGNDSWHAGDCVAVLETGNQWT